MEFFIDDADIKKIERIYNGFPIDGVTTNPSILSKIGGKPFEILKKIRDLIGKDGKLHVQAVSSVSDEMLEEAKTILKKLGENTYIKIPVTHEGLITILKLAKSGIRVTATAIYSHMQAFFAAKAGADYVAPYVNRIDNLGYDGIDVVREIHEIFKANNFKTKILAASFKNTRQITKLCIYGIDAVTVSSNLIENMLDDKNVGNAVIKFANDFAALCGENKNMLNCN